MNVRLCARRWVRRFSDLLSLSFRKKQRRAVQKIKFNKKIHEEFEIFGECESGRHLMVNPKNRYDHLGSLKTTTRGMAIALISVTGLHALAVIVLFIHGIRTTKDASKTLAMYAQPDSRWGRIYNFTTMAAAVLVVIMVTSFYANIVSRDTCMEGIAGSDWHACKQDTFGVATIDSAMSAKVCVEAVADAGLDAANQNFLYTGLAGQTVPFVADADSDANDKTSATWQVCEEVGKEVENYFDNRVLFNALFDTGKACAVAAGATAVSPSAAAKACVDAQPPTDDGAGNCAAAGCGDAATVGVEANLAASLATMEQIFGAVKPGDGETAYSSAQVAAFALNCGDPKRDPNAANPSHMYPDNMFKDVRDDLKKIFSNVRALNWIIAAAILPLFFYAYDNGRALRYAGDSLWLRVQSQLHIITAAVWALIGVAAIIVAQSISHNKLDQARAQCAVTTSGEDFLFTDKSEKNADTGIIFAGILALLSFGLTLVLVHNKRFAAGGKGGKQMKAKADGTRHWFQFTDNKTMILVGLGVIMSAAVLLMLRPLQFQAAAPCDIVEATEVNAMTKMYVVAIASIGFIVAISYIFVHAGHAGLVAMDKLTHFVRGKGTTHKEDASGKLTTAGVLNAEEQDLA